LITLSRRFNKPPTELTPREHEVWEYVKQGLTNKEIALRLKVTFRTIEMHRANAKQKIREAAMV